MRTLFFSFIVLFLLTQHLYSSAQKLDKAPKYRLLTLTPPGKTIKTRISYKKLSLDNINKYYYWFDGAAINCTQGGNSGYLLDGDYEEISYPGKHLICKGSFTNGQKDGEWTTWFESGKIKTLENYKNGKLNGNQYEFDEKGKTIASKYYENGELYKPENDTLTAKQQKVNTLWHKVLAKTHLKKQTAAKAKKK